MQHRTISIFFAALSGCCIGYFTALMIDSPSPVSFSYVWLAIGLFFSLLSFLIRRGKIHIPELQGSLICTAIVTGFAVVGINLYSIMTPSVSTGNEKVPYLIVLGGGLKTDGSLSAIPERRIRRAAAYLHAHPYTKVIVSGGRGKYLPVAEAPVLASALETLGIDRSRILQEDQALDTIQNLSYSARLMALDAGTDLSKILNTPVVILTSRYHLARAERIATLEGYRKVYGIASGIPVLYVLNAYSREICSYVKLNLRILFTGQPASLVSRKPHMSES